MIYLLFVKRGLHIVTCAKEGSERSFLSCFFIGRPVQPGPEDPAPLLPAVQAVIVESPTTKKEQSSHDHKFPLNYY